MSFDYGADPVSTGGKLKQAAIGAHEARLLGIIHLGMFEDEFKGKKKPAAPFVCALFELKSGEEGGGVNEDGSPIIVHKSFPLKKGDKAYLTSFMEVFLSAQELQLYKAGALNGGFDDFIGKPVQLTMEGSSATNEDGSPAYVNVAAITKLPPKFAAMVDELENEPIGHITLDRYTDSVLRHLPPFEIYSRLEKSLNFAGSKADEVLRAARAADPEFAKKKVKDGQATTNSGTGGEVKNTPAPDSAPPELDDSQDFS